MLTAKCVERTKKPGRYRDSGGIRGLLLQISANGAKSWVLRYERHGKERMMGLGSCSEFTLKEARERARQARQLLADGIDPLARKHADKQAAKLADQRKLTFREAAQRFFDQNESKWRSAKHRDQFLSTLRVHAFDVLGDMDVAAIDTPDILRAFESLWKTKAITADRTRSRVEQVIDWAVVRGHRPPGTNPARWKGHLDQVLPAPRKVAPIAHHAALSYQQMPAFMAALHQQDTVAARALEFLILSAARTGEVIGARWDEIDIHSNTWTVPAERMKAGREHRVPLSDAAIALLQGLPTEQGNPHVFIGRHAGAGLSRMALPWVMDRLGQSGATTIHGFRSSFRDWCSELGGIDDNVAELSLNHKVGNAVQQAYFRSTLLDKRRVALTAYADWLSGREPASNVVPLRTGAA